MTALLLIICAAFIVICFVAHQLDMEMLFTLTFVPILVSITLVFSTIVLALIKMWTEL